jgi:hypothetical protein
MNETNTDTYVSVLFFTKCHLGCLDLLSVLDQNLREIVIRTLLAIKVWLTHTSADVLSLKNVFSCRIAVRYKTSVKWKYFRAE